MSLNNRGSSSILRPSHGPGDRECGETGRLDLGLRNLQALRVDVLSDKVVHTDKETGAQTV